MEHLGLENETFSSEQIKQLLYNAEQRLKVSAPATHPPHISFNQTKISATSQSQSIPRLSQPRSGIMAKPYINLDRGIARAEPSRLLTEKDRRVAEDVRNVGNQQEKMGKKKDKKLDAGADWFHLPRTDLTPELKRDLQILRMRSILDPKRHYKKTSSKALAPEFSQVGTVIQGPTEYYSSRIPNKDRKRTLAEEILATEDSTGRFRHKYNDLQLTKTSGKKTFYKGLQAKRHKGVKRR